MLKPIPFAFFFLLPIPAVAQPSFAGTWETTFGTMTLTQDGKKVTGFYLYEGIKCKVAGEVEKNKLTFTYEEPDVKGEGWFGLAADGKSFKGQWRPTGEKGWGEWIGTRAVAAAVPEAGFSGLWNTSYGSMRLSQSEGNVKGVYGPGAYNTIEGKLEGKKLTFTYKEPTAAGEGTFELSADGKSFKGTWREKGKGGTSSWTGTRVEPVKGKQWLVILEANWETDLRQQEYAFGAMLRAFFARSEQIKVRHRIFTDVASFGKWCREVTYLAEPVVLVIATHGSPQGATVDGKTIGAKALADNLRYCDNIKLLHFSACLMMKDKLASEMISALEKRAAFPISGYTTSVDWAASAVIEFLYFDMVLMRNTSPARAAEEIVKLMPFAGDKRVPGTSMPASGFKIVAPSSTTASK